MNPYLKALLSKIHHIFQDKAVQEGIDDMDEFTLVGRIAAYDRNADMKISLKGLYQKLLSPFALL